MTFTNDADALTFKNTIFPLIDSKDVVYALVYYLGNTHHYSNPLPDVILEKIEYGDQNAVIGSSP